jgi:hypothetical protein
MPQIHRVVLSQVAIVTPLRVEGPRSPYSQHSQNRHRNVSLYMFSVNKPPPQQASAPTSPEKLGAPLIPDFGKSGWSRTHAARCIKVLKSSAKADQILEVLAGAKRLVRPFVFLAANRSLCGLKLLTKSPGSLASSNPGQIKTGHAFKDSGRYPHRVARLRHFVCSLLLHSQDQTSTKKTNDLYRSNRARGGKSYQSCRFYLHSRLHNPHEDRDDGAFLSLIRLAQRLGAKQPVVYAI